MNTNAIINDYIDALVERAENAGDDKLGVAAGYFYEALRALKLQSYELETLLRLTDYMKADAITQGKAS